MVNEQVDKKLFGYFIRKARADTKFGKTKLKDKKWQAMASNMSKEMINDYATVPAKIRAKKSAEYLKHRATARYGDYGGQHPIDTGAVRKYQKITKTTLIR
jgi:hypothetical protein